MSATNLLETTDAMIWATEFILIAEQNDWTLNDIDESLMISWFANAFCAQEFKDAKRIKELESERDRLREAAQQFLNDLEKRTSNMAHHPDEAIRDHYGDGNCLPVGDGVLYALRKALKDS